MNMIKRIKPLGWLVVCSLVVFVICIPFLFFSHASHASKQITHKMRENHQLPKDFISNEELPDTPGMFLQTELINEDTYSSIIRYPYTKIESIDAKILEWITQEKERFVNDLTNEDDHVTAHLTIQFDIHTLTNAIYNLTATAERSFGEEKTINKTSFTVDLSNKRQVLIDDFILNSSNSSFKEFIDQEIHTIIEDETVIQQFMNDSLLESIDQLNWGLTKEDFIVYPKNPVSTERIMQLPIEQMAQFIQDQWLETFNLTDEIDLREKKRQEAKEIVTTPDVHKDPDGKYIALTFDDGPHPDVTPRILETLDIYDAKATFFMLGLQVEKHPDVAAEVARRGHEIANHSQTHKDLTTLNQDQLMNEIQGSNQLIHQITGQKPILYRPPYGSYNEHIKQIIQQNGLSIMLWSVDSLDWKNRNQQTITSTVTAEATVDSTILMHDIHPTTADALPNIVKQLSDDGYEFVTVSELLAIQDERHKSEAF
ncbi:MAG TPA: polysaccharide deacetylase family protein [Bacillota bacterium]|nr:polysaccharide deacetylase family protein [Bacillota bacterium]